MRTNAIAARHGYDVEKIAAVFAERSEASGRRTASPSAPVDSGGADSIVPLRGDEISSWRTQQVENLLPQDPAKKTAGDSATIVAKTQITQHVF